MLSLGVGVLSFDLSNNVSYANASEQVLLSETTAAGTAVLKKEAPATLEELQQASDEQLNEWINLKKFDGRDYNYVTSQKPQGAYYVCWAFAAAGLAELSVLRQGLVPGNPEETKNTLDFDDLHVAWASKNMDKTSNPLNLMKDDAPSAIDWNDGGHINEALYSMTDGYSPIPQQEKDDFKKTIPSEYIAEQAMRIDESKDSIKKAILKYGGVGFAYKPGTYGNYMCLKEHRTSHASVIVGWDDSIDRKLFKPDTPDANGAWIVKNSWSANGADQVGGIGACYLSYEAYMKDLFVVDMGLKSDYPNIYQYDGSAVDSNASVSDIEANAAIYEAKLSDPKNEEYLKAIQVGFNAKDVDLNIDIYKLNNVNPGNVNDKINDPTKGVLIHHESTYFEKDGFYTIKLKKEISLTQGEYFSIVLYDKNNKDLHVISGIDSTSTNDMTFYRIKNKDGKNEWRNYKYSTAFDYANNADIGHTARIRAITETRKREIPLDEKDLQYARIEVDNGLKFYQKGVEQKPTIMVSIGDKELKENQDYSVNVAENNIKPGTVKVTITGINPYHGSRTTVFEIAKLYYPDNVPQSTMTVYNNVTTLADIQLPEGWEWLSGNKDTISAGQTTTFTIKYTAEDYDCYINNMFDIRITKLNENPPDRISLDTAIIVVNGSYKYTGHPIIPNLTVTMNNISLIKDTDYSVKCDNNINAGTATVTIIGIGLYMDERSQDFTIRKADQPPIMPQTNLEVSRKVKKLSEIQDFLPEGWTWQNGEIPIIDDTTSVTAEYYDQKNYENYTQQITITRADMINIETLKITILQSTKFVYNNGKQICPELEILDGDYPLRKNEDYTVDYQDNTNAGQGKIIVSGCGEYYQGTTTLYFTIQRAERTDFKVTQSGWTYGDTSPSPSVTGGMEVAAITYTYSTSEIGTYNSTKPTNAGTYWIKAKIEASKNYNATESKARFVISPKDLSRFTTEIKDDNLIYTGQEIKPQIVIKDGQTNLKENTDFVVTYSNNINAGNQASIIIQGENNYTGTINRTFKILKAAQPNNVPQTINVSIYAKKLGDIKLPTGWKWENPTLEITEDMATARIVRIDANNYVQSTFDIKLNFVDKPDQPTDETINDSVLWWGLGIIGGTVIIGIVWWLISKRKKKWWKN